MAQRALRTEDLTCPICLDILKEPVTLPCGHSYCRDCIQTNWDQEVRNRCPQCRESFTPRPILVKNTVLANLVEELKSTGIIAPSADLCYAAPGDVSCDVCTGRKLKAVSSCLQCLVSYCESHLQPHRLAVFQSHQLVAPSDKLQEHLCSEHKELKKLFCRTDQLIICSLCSMDQHQGHDTVSSAAERAQRQKQVEAKRALLQQKIYDKENQEEWLQNEAQDTSWSARKQLQQDVTDLKRSISELDTLCLIPNHNQFILLCSSLSTHTEETESKVQSGRDFEHVTRAVSALRDLNMSEPELNSREDFLRFACDITLDPNTLNRNLSLSNGNRKVKSERKVQIYSRHPDRFVDSCQVMSRLGLRGRCYWEVELSGNYGVTLAVSYRDVPRSGIPESFFGSNDKSWAFLCRDSYYFFYFNNSSTRVSGPFSRRIGIYLDHSAGVLSFYSVRGETMSLLHRVRTSFTQPLFPGVKIQDSSDTAHFIKLK